MLLCIELPSGHTAKIGELFPVTKELISFYMKMYERVWVQI